MGLADWKAIYRGYSTEELNVEMEELKADLKGSFSAQASGSVSHQREVRELRDRLRAATEIRNERGGRHRPRRGQVDFSGTDIDDL